MNPTATPTEPEIEYPSSDGKPMAENTLQYRWIVTIAGNVDALFAARDDVFVAGDNLIYPVRGNNKVRQAPDVYVAFGRPKGDRGSYQVWLEGGIFPQVVFEVRSPGNRAGEMARRFRFYDRYGAEEYYDLDPDRNRLRAYTRPPGGRLTEVGAPDGFASPRLGVRFDLSGPELVIFYPTGEPFLTFQQLADARNAERRRADAQQARADAAARQVDQVRQEADRLRALLRAAGIDPDAAPPG